MSNETPGLFGNNGVSHSGLKKSAPSDNDTKQESDDLSDRRRRALEDGKKRLVEARKRIAKNVSAFKKGNERDRLKRPKKDERNGRATIFLVIRVSDRRRRDLDNMVSTILDTMVKTGVVDDDSVQKIGSENTKVAFVPKGQEGFDLMILEE